MMEVEGRCRSDWEASMTTLRPADVAVEALAGMLAHGTATLSATTFDSPSWGYAVPRTWSCCDVPCDERAVERVTAFVERHRADLAQTRCYLRLTQAGSVIKAALVDMGYDLLGAPLGCAHDPADERPLRELTCPIKQLPAA
jgi:hypothetical protein